MNDCSQKGELECYKGRATYMLARVVVLMLLSLITFRCSSADIKDVQRLREEIFRAVPVGSGSMKTVAYADANQIEHSEHDDSASDRVIKAMIRSKSSIFKLVRTDYGVLFRFDKLDRLTNVEVEPAYTGP